MVTYKDGSETVTARVAGFSTTNNRLDLVSHAVANPKQNYIGINVLLRDRGLRRIYVSSDGRVRNRRQGQIR